MKKNYPFQTHLLVNNFEDLFTRRTFSLKINVVNNSTNSALNTDKKENKPSSYFICNTDMKLIRDEMLLIQKLN